uniref:Transglutaminase-like domain-containing protein n=1 Tax=Arcella intermedia TaxID=1963864 RepID=A0A6B2KZB6_9EUKA
MLSAHPEEQLTIIPVKSAGDKGDFYAYFSDASKITVNIPATVPVGQYTLDLRVDDNVVTHFSEPFIVLFNPWSPEDTVFLDNETLRKEYVLEENGLIWRGSANENGPCSWNFAQFQKTIVIATLRLLEAVSIDDRANPAVVTRRLTVLENDKVLYGNWSGNYAGGSSPSSWTGSKEIISQFYQTGKPVKFGQCWVFSGVLTTLCRSIGIPCRSVTNFESAHDTNFNRVVDKYYVPDGTLDKEKTNDSVWNFHVWNDAWFSRPDIPDKRFSGPGWQAIDATPQEKSDGEYQTGPCPLAAIKEGTEVPFDWKFIFGEVNADVRHYVKSQTGEYKLVQTETASVGKNMSTKAVGRMQKEDVTLQYKYPEGSKEERTAFGAEEANKELLVFGRMEVPEVQTGQDVPVSIFLKATKETGEEKTVKILVKATVVSYTGKERGVIINSNHDIKIPGDASEIELTLKIASEHYLPYASEHFSINLQLFIFSDKDAEVDSLITKRFSLKDQLPTIDAPEKVGVNEPGNVTIQYTNPLSTPLTNLFFSIEGSGLVSHTKTKPKTLAPGETTSESISLKGPKKVGERVIKVLVSSKELETVFNYKSVTVF